MTTKQKHAYLFSIYFFVFLLTLLLSFFAIFRLGFIYRIKKDMSKEIVKIISEHIGYSQGTLVFLEDAEGNSLRDELLRSGFSGLFLDSNLNLVKGFGIFSRFGSTNQDQVVILVDKSREAVKEGNTSQGSFVWQGVRIFAYFIPLTNEGQIRGVAILGKSIAEIDTVTGLFGWLFIIFGLVSIPATFVLARFLVAQAFSPVIKLTKVIDEIDLDRLDKLIDVSGNDKDELVDLAKHFNQMLERIKTMAQQNKEFISNVSHELKTPLTKAISSLEVLDAADTDFKENLTLIKRDLFELNNLIEKLLYLSRLRKETAGESPSVNLSVLIENLCEKWRDEITRKNIDVMQDIPKELAVKIPLEYAETLLSNLLTNSIKYSRSGSSIDITGTTENSRVVVVIRDTGVGMDKDEVKKVSERFFRGRQGRKLAQGSGVGLSIVKRICDLYGIGLEFKSVLNVGTVVTLRFS